MAEGDEIGSGGEDSLPAWTGTGTVMTASPAPVSGSGTPAEPVAPRRPFARWRPPTAVAAVVLGLVAGQAAALTLILTTGGKGEANAFDGLALLLGDVALLAVILAFARRGARLSAGTLGIRRTRFWPALGWAAAIFAGTIAAMGLWTLLVGGGGEQSPPGGGTPPVIAVALIMLGVAVGAPIVEEIAFRGYLFAALTTWRGPWPAALVTAVLFGAAHVAAAPPEILPALAFFGFAACMLFWFTGSLLPCVGIHALNNALVVSLLAGWTWQVPLALIGAVALSIALLLPFAREYAPSPRPRERS
jgi:membrane protease YdiL (CAAX protease family)